MLDRVRERFTSAHLLALLALFVALGGTAGALAGKNTVDSGDVKKNALKKKDLKRESVAKAEIAPDSVGAEEASDALGIGLVMGRLNGVEIPSDGDSRFGVPSGTGTPTADELEALMPLPPSTAGPVAVRDLSVATDTGASPSATPLIVNLGQIDPNSDEDLELLECQIGPGESGCTSGNEQTVADADGQLYFRVTYPGGNETLHSTDFMFSWRAITP